MFVPVAFRLGDTTVYSRVLEGMATRARDLTVPLTAIGRSLVKNIGQQFMSEGAWAQTRWAPLSDRYAQWKEANYPGRPILVRTGQMRAAVLEGGRQMIVTPRSLLYTPAERTVTVADKTRAISHTYNLAEIAYYHQVGAGHLPARPMVAFPLTELREWDRILISWLNGREPMFARG